MDIHDQIRRLGRRNVFVKMEIEVTEATAFWLCWLGEQHGDTPQHQASTLLDDIRQADEEAHGEEPSVLQ